MVKKPFVAAWTSLLVSSSLASSSLPTFNCEADDAGGFRHSEESGFDSKVVKFRLPYEWRLVTIDNAAAELNEAGQAELYKSILDTTSIDQVPQDVWARSDAEELAALVHKNALAGYLLRRTDRSPQDWFNYEVCKDTADGRISCSGWFIGASFVFRKDTRQFTAAEAPVPYMSAQDIFVAHGTCTPYYD